MRIGLPFQGLLFQLGDRAIDRSRGARPWLGLGFALIAGLMGAINLVDGVELIDVRGYKQPPAEVVDLFAAPREPVIDVSPLGDALLIAWRERYAPLRSLVAPTLNLGGINVDRDNGAARRTRYRRMEVLWLAGMKRIQLALPSDARCDLPRWSPNGERLAITCVSSGRTSLWIAEPHSGKAVRLPEIQPNLAFGQACQWLSDGARLVCLLRDQSPGSSILSLAPLIEDSRAHIRKQPAAFASARARLRSKVAIVDSAIVHSARAPPKWLGRSILARAVSPSPQGRYLLVSRVSTRTSNDTDQIAWRDQAYEIWDHRGQLVKEIPSTGILAADLSQQRPQTHLLRRNVTWRRGGSAEQAAALSYGELHTPMMPGQASERLMMFDAPFNEPPREVFASTGRLSQVAWLRLKHQVFVDELDRVTGRKRAYLLDDDPRSPGTARTRLLWDLSARGAEHQRPLVTGRLLQSDGKAIYVTGRESDGRAYLDRLDIGTQEVKRIWAAPSGTTIAAIMNPAATRLLLREASAAGVNYYLQQRHELTKPPTKQLVVQSPMRALAELGVVAQQLSYQRSDGVRLSATFYRPAHLGRAKSLPLVVWTYPRVFADANTASGSISRASRRNPSRRNPGDRAVPLYLAMRGYAVLDQVAMPIVRNTARGFVAQLVENAELAIQAAVGTGVVDRDRTGIAGHSFGAFSVVTLLAHSDLFRAGVAMSGAYNRTITPFGFQTERRTLWQAREHYLRMSPYLRADRIGAPLLLVHGEADSNAGTTPLQSRMLFEALRRHGATARLVLLPFEGHLYRARESVLHSAAEMLEWFDQHVKNVAIKAASKV